MKTNKKSQPNIILILADHVAFEGHYANDRFHYRWPNLEKLAKKGAWFENAYAVTPVCTPSRASLLTGKRPDKHGMRWNCEYPIPDNRKEFRDDEIIFPQALKKAGYDNYYYGKWHCGTKRGPKEYGLKGWSLPEYGNVYRSDEYKKYLKRIGEEQPSCLIDHHLMRPKLDGTTVLMDPDEPWDYMDGVGKLLGSSEVQEQFFVANLAIDALKDIADKNNRKDKERTSPFSMVVSLWGPHHPYYPSEEYAEKINPADIPKYPSFDDDLSNKPLRYRIHRDLRCLHRAYERWSDWKTWQTVLARCYAAGLQTDAAIGRIIKALEKTGLDENTIIIVTADHGDAVASHGGGWDKYSTYTQEVGKIPLVMKWLGEIPQGVKIPSPVNLMDVTATMLSVANVDKDNLHPLKLDGENLIPFTNNEQTRETMIVDHYGHSGDVSYQKIAYHLDWKYVSAYGDDDELYNLKYDPYEMNNLMSHEDTHEIQHNMRDLIIDHIEERRSERAIWHKPDFLERGIVFSSPEWPREETLQLYKLKVQQGYKT